MPLQNRVTPFGELVAHPSRSATLIGNRGIIHDPETRTLTGRRWTTKAWIACACRVKGRHRDVWAARSWTELFFLDEATALAAGHRPCFECRRAEALAFVEAWAAGNGVSTPRAADLDAVLHLERRGDRHPIDKADMLPVGTMVAAGTTPLLRVPSGWQLWTFGGYVSPVGNEIPDRMLTPPSIVNALRAGYLSRLHGSAG